MMPDRLLGWQPVNVIPGTMIPATYNISKNGGYPVQNNASKKKTREMASSTPTEKNLKAHATSDTLHGSPPNLDDCVRRAFLCQPRQRVCERCAYEDERAKK